MVLRTEPRTSSMLDRHLLDEQYPETPTICLFAEKCPHSSNCGVPVFEIIHTYLFYSLLADA